jgi:hypothetical protein
MGSQTNNGKHSANFCHIDIVRTARCVQAILMMERVSSSRYFVVNYLPIELLLPTAAEDLNGPLGENRSDHQQVELEVCVDFKHNTIIVSVQRSTFKYNSHPFGCIIVSTLIY